MSEQNEDIEVILEEPKVAPQDPVVEVAKVAEPAKEAAKAIDPDEGLEALKQKLDAERAGRLTAERQRDEASATARSAHAEAQDSNLHLVTNSIALLKQSTEGLKGRYSVAMAAGDYDAAADVQAEMSSNAAKLVRLEEGKQHMEAEAKKPAAAPQQSTDPVEFLASQLSPRSAAWVRSHPEFARDQRLYRRMLAAHNLAETDGIALDTDDYFTAIEGTLGLRRAVADPVDDPSADAAQVVQRRASPAAAPVSRSGNGDGSRPNTVRLSPAEVEMAENMGMKPEEYARNKQALIKEGKLH